jgi:hypothetical protein
VLTRPQVPQEYGHSVRSGNITEVLRAALLPVERPTRLELETRYLNTTVGRDWPDSDKYILVAYRIGSVAYVREWRQREFIGLPFTLRESDSDRKGPFAIRVRLRIHSAVFGLQHLPGKTDEKHRRSVAQSLRTIVGRASMLRMLVVHIGDVPGFGALPTLGTLALRCCRSGADGRSQEHATWW